MEQEAFWCPGMLAGVLAGVLALAACASPPVEGEVHGESFAPGQLIQSDANRFANLAMRDNLDSLEILLEKLYRRNPSMWKRRTSDTLEQARGEVMSAIREVRPLAGVGEHKGVDAIRLALMPEFSGDRAGTYVYGLGSMLVEAWGGHVTQSLIRGLNAQRVANAAHNTAVAAWLLAERRDHDGKPLLLADEISDNGRNLSFAREHGKIIGRLDTLAAVIDEKYRRSVIGYLQGLAGGQLLQFLPLDAAASAAGAAVAE
ncbi:hypothetical protein AGMMS49543_20310 [Betaproteobacteria bacterium]|nr:hypothetical protein AGMMS49543_20310 [Betaproteobacteria bacterium]GHU20188.1 hypothetical protein AGMMS50243_14090 [Betaproteobacteria bacterium]